MEDDFISLKQLAVELGLDRPNTRKYASKVASDLTSVVPPDSGGQLTLALTAEQAERIRSKRREEGFLGSARSVAKESDVFYLIQLVPELDPGESSWDLPRT